MGLKKAENQVKILLAETILSMCRNTLNYHAEICVEGLLGITLDNEEIFLVNINQTIKNQIDTPGKAASSKENLKRSRKEDVGSDTEPESSSNESESSSTKKRRKRVRRKKHKGEKGSGSENGELADVSANADQTLQSDETDRKFSQVNLEQTDGSEQYYENSNQTAGDDSYTEEGAPSSVNVTVKQEPPGGPESDDDLVFVKQEVDEFSMSQPSAHQFSNLSQVFQSSADMSLSQPSDMMSGAFFASPANNMSANAMQQPVPGPSGANTEAENRRFAEFSEEELSQLGTRSDNKTTLAVIRCARNAFMEYCRQRKPQHVDLLNICETSSAEELLALNDVLRSFYAEARQKNGQLYTGTTIVTMRYGLQRHFLKGNVDIATHPIFQSSNEMFRVVKKKLRAEQIPSPPKSTVSTEDLKKLYQSDTLSVKTPEGLQNKVFVDVMLYLCKHSKNRETLREMRKTDFSVYKDMRGQKFIDLAGEKMFAVPGNVYCPVASFEKYISLLSDKCEDFWQRPHTNLSKGWYDGTPMGIRSLAAKMKQLSRAAGLSKDYTNACLKRTTPLDFKTFGVEATKIILVANQANPNAINSIGVAQSQGVNVCGAMAPMSTVTLSNTTNQFSNQPILLNFGGNIAAPQIVTPSPSFQGNLSQANFAPCITEVKSVQEQNDLG